MRISKIIEGLPKTNSVFFGYFKLQKAIILFVDRKVVWSQHHAFYLCPGNENVFKQCRNSYSLVVDGYHRNILDLFLGIEEKIADNGPGETGGYIQAPSQSNEY